MGCQPGKCRAALPEEVKAEDRQPRLLGCPAMAKLPQLVEVVECHSDEEVAVEEEEEEEEEEETEEEDPPKATEDPSVPAQLEAAEELAAAVAAEGGTPSLLVLDQAPAYAAEPIFGPPRQRAEVVEEDSPRAREPGASSTPEAPAQDSPRAREPGASSTPEAPAQEQDSPRAREPGASSTPEAPAQDSPQRAGCPASAPPQEALRLPLVPRLWRSIPDRGPNPFDSPVAAEEVARTQRLVAPEAAQPPPPRRAPLLREVELTTPKEEEAAHVPGPVLLGRRHGVDEAVKLEEEGHKLATDKALPQAERAEEPRPGALLACIGLRGMAQCAGLSRLK